MDNASDGQIILMHDIFKESVDAAEIFIPQLLQEGYQLVTVSELAAAKGTVRKCADSRGSDIRDGADVNERSKKSQDKVHDRTSKYDYHTLPHRLAVERPGIVAVVPLALHRTGTADGKRADNVLRFLPLLAEYHGTHSEGKLVHLDSAELCGGEMSKFVDYDNDQISHRILPQRIPRRRRGSREYHQGSAPE